MFTRHLQFICFWAAKFVLTSSQPPPTFECAETLAHSWKGGDGKLKTGWMCVPKDGKLEILFCTERVKAITALSCTERNNRNKVVLPKSTCESGYSQVSVNTGKPLSDRVSKAPIKQFFCDDPVFPEPLSCDPGTGIGVFRWCYPGDAKYSVQNWPHKIPGKSILPKPNAQKTIPDGKKPVTGNSSESAYYDEMMSSDLPSDEATSTANINNSRFVWFDMIFIPIYMCLYMVA
ncbi:hypothetical protein CROQUDRAFT_100384 [Cronartium quercuum f. sp. fusiforme G11]|uniref:Uncharacterized protein n=1 Tax=Cronartium quercuum f. sp. fusiforme G11 TaxID=708437 RepID=A0A9P6N785_9BASI|nr:hypothetical protein CROQUDRAFT_100384 [Cronartium quercuum f. sp. fusiforme G11]